MKKLIALAALAACLPTFAGTVESSNTVGYTKIQLKTGYNMVGMQFVNVGGESQDLATFGILDTSYAGYDDDYKFTNKLRTWNAGQQEYGYYGWAGSSGTEVDEDSTLDYTWTDMEAYAVADPLPLCSGVWVNVDKPGTMLFKGEVVTTNVTITLSAGYNLIANPYPVEVPVTNFGVLDGTFEGYDDDYKFSCKMRTWDVDNQEYGYFGWAGTSGTSVDEDPSLDNTWTDMEAYAVSDTVPVGGAVWIYVPHTGTITFTSPMGAND